MFYLFYRHASFFAFIISKKNSATYAYRIGIAYVWDMIKQSKPLQTRYDTTYIYDRYYVRTHVYVFLLSVKKTRVWIIASLTLKVILWGYPIHGFLSAQSFIRLVKLVWREYDIVVMNEWKKKCVGLQRTWVSKRTVYLIRILFIWSVLFIFIRQMHKAIFLSTRKVHYTLTIAEYSVF